MRSFKVRSLKTAAPSPQPSPAQRERESRAATAAFSCVTFFWREARCLPPPSPHRDGEKVRMRGDAELQGQIVENRSALTPTLSRAAGEGVARGDCGIFMRDV